MLNLNTFSENLELLCKAFEQKKFLLAISGGADSMVLAKLFQDKDLSFQIAHVNYKLREEDSDLDQKLVEEFCKNHQIKIHIYEVSDRDKKPENSVQLWARNLRYEFFFKILETENLDFVVTAHHLNDELETFLINLSRGSGIKGLSGIPANENRILRPLLQFTKNEIYAFAKGHQIAFREDLSNQKNDYLRNKIRNEIVPQLTEINEHFLQNFSKSLKYLSQTKNFVEEEISKIEDQMIRVNDENLVIDKNLFSKQNNFVKFEILRKLGFSGIELEKIIKAENGKFFRSNSHEITIKREEILGVKKQK